MNKEYNPFYFPEGLSNRLQINMDKVQCIDDKSLWKHHYRLQTAQDAE